MAGKMKVTLPADPAVDAEVDLGPAGSGYALAARLNVSLPDVDREVANRLREATRCVLTPVPHMGISRS
jgi:osmotically inducible protein OsmC